MRDLLETTRPARAACYHGGSFWEALGNRFDRLSGRDEIVVADVLDAWFPPAPGVVDFVREHAELALRTSPPTQCEGLVHSISEARGLDPTGILPGAGSSNLMFLALREWLSPSSRVLILDPCYGEYAHIFQHVIGCHVDAVVLSREDGFVIDLDDLALRSARGYDLIVLVNPSNPVGHHIPRSGLEPSSLSSPHNPHI